MTSHYETIEWKKNTQSIKLPFYPFANARFRSAKYMHTVVKTGTTAHLQTLVISQQL